MMNSFLQELVTEGVMMKKNKAKLSKMSLKELYVKSLELGLQKVLQKVFTGRATMW